MSPILWDLGHIAHFEELWLTRNLDGPIEFVEMPGMYNPFEHPRSTRGSLPLPGLPEVRRVFDEIRGAGAGPARRGSTSSAADTRCCTKGTSTRWCCSTSTSTTRRYCRRCSSSRGRPTRRTRPVRSARERRGAPARGRDGPVPRRHGRDRHRRPVGGLRQRAAAAPGGRAPFWIDVHPVTNGEYLSLIDAGGYARRELWSEAGWALARPRRACRRPNTGRGGGRVAHPVRWTGSAPVEPSHPVCHVCWHEAEAFARFAGKRLPTEIEWETAASWDPAAGTERTYPWGEAAAHAARWPTSTSSASARRRSAPIPATFRRIGCYGMIGDVWEWTASDFGPWPGYESFPYKEYSEVFFGPEYKVLRGGSWATRPGAVRNTFRNWDYPIRRQIFSGFRCARDD